jgi:uncharacterized protein YwgA
MMTEEGMRARDVVLAILARGEGRAEFGRTSLQKVAYLAGKALERDLGHRAHYYGPFSSVIESETETLVLSDLVEEKVRSLGFANSAGFEAKQYDYKLTEAGRERLALINDRYGLQVETVNHVVDSLIENVGGLDQRMLSPAAKVDYIATREGRPVTKRDVRMAASDLGWSLNDSQIDSVVELLSKLGFIHVTHGADIG